MRVGVVTSAPRGGLLHYAVQLADALARQGHDVTLIAPRGNELSAHRGAAERREVLRGPGLPGPPAPGRAGRARHRVHLGARLVATLLRTALELRQGRFDAAVLTDDPDVAVTAGGLLLLTALPGRPLLAAVCHEPRPRNRHRPGELYVAPGPTQALLRRAYPRLDVVLVHGARSRDTFVASWPPSRVEVIPHGDESIFAASPPAPATEERLLFFGEWRRAKGLPELLAAFDRLVRRRPDARLTLAGRPCPDGEPERVRQWAAARSGLVELREEYVPMDEVAGLFARARAVVTPYVAGAQSGVVHLAMTMGRAVVASDIGDLPEAVRHGETGLVVPAGDVAALADALERVLAEPGLAERLGRAARERVERESSWERVAERVARALAPSPAVRHTSVS